MNDVTGHPTCRRYHAVSAGTHPSPPHSSVTRSYFPGEQAQLHSRLLFHVSALACTRGGSVGCVINTYGSITALKYFLQGFLRVGNCLCGLLYLPLVVFLRLPRATSHSPHGFDKLSRLNERERENRYVSHRYFVKTEKLDRFAYHVCKQRSACAVIGIATEVK